MVAEKLGDCVASCNALLAGFLIGNERFKSVCDIIYAKITFIEFGKEGTRCEDIDDAVMGHIQANEIFSDKTIDPGKFVHDNGGAVMKSEF